MNVSRPLSLLSVLLLAACSSHAPKSTPPVADTAVVSPSPAETAPQASVAEPSLDATATASTAATDSVPAASDATAVAEDSATAAAPTVAEDDFAALYGTPAPQAGSDSSSEAGTAAVSYDPWERYNRSMHRFNLGLDRYIAHPLATAYVHVVPTPARLGVSNFFDNLKSPVTMVNQLLQGHPVKALKTLGRFVMNTTLGIGGLFDPATAAGLPHGSEDFGQTLGVWGWHNSRYFELPLFGPRTLRDTFGLAGDIPLSPLRQIDDTTVRYGLTGVQLVNTRANYLSLDDMRNEAPDEYALTRDAWMQRRNYMIQQDLHHPKGENNDDLPDYLREDTTVPTDGIPIP